MSRKKIIVIADADNEQDLGLVLEEVEMGISEFGWLRGHVEVASGRAVWQELEAVNENVWWGRKCEACIAKAT